MNHNLPTFRPGDVVHIKGHPGDTAVVLNVGPCTEPGCHKTALLVERTPGSFLLWDQDTGRWHVEDAEHVLTPHPRRRAAQAQPRPRPRDDAERGLLIALAVLLDAERLPRLADMAGRAIAEAYDCGWRDHAEGTG